ncbi:MAG: DUF2190 family protein [Phycisphaerales bacterium JB065]
MGLRSKMGPYRFWPATAAADLSAGDVQMFGDNIAGVATKNIASGELADLAVEGTFEADKAEGFSIDPGDVALYDTSEGMLVSDANSNTKEIGVCIEAADTDATTCLVGLDWTKTEADDPNSSSSSGS